MSPKHVPVAQGYLPSLVDLVPESAGGGYGYQGYEPYVYGYGGELPRGMGEVGLGGEGRRREEEKARFEAAENLMRMYREKVDDRERGYRVRKSI